MMMKTSLIPLFFLLFVVAGIFFFSGDDDVTIKGLLLRGGNNNSNDVSHRNLYEIDYDGTTDADAEVTEAPTLTQEQLHYRHMIRYHWGMRPCLHKSYYALVGALNPSLKEGLTEQEKHDVSFFHTISDRFFGTSEEEAAPEAEAAEEPAK